MLVQFSVRYQLIMKPTSNLCDLPTSSTNISLSSKPVVDLPG